MADPRLCSIPDCGKPARRRGLCNAHYHRWLRHGDPMGGRKYRFGAQCSVAGCDKPHHAHNYCRSHLHRFKNHGDPLGGGTYIGEPERFYREEVLTYDGDECLIWPYSKDRHGYAQMSGGYVSRLVCEEEHGPPPTPEHQAAHSCGKGHLGCVTKGHLSWKTRAENEADKLIHGTSNRGERHGMTRLSNDDVIRIKKLLTSPMMQKDIALKFGVSPMTISNIKLGRSWGWLTPE